MPELAYVNGEILPIDKAVVPIEDRGHQFGDGVYEVTSIGTASLENVETTLDSQGGIVCEILETQQDQFVDDLTAQLEASIGELLVELNEQLVGTKLCE